MKSSTATIGTAKATGYLQQLCKHFGHKVPAEFTNNAGRITFEMGVASLSAEGDVLHIRVEGADDAAVERLETVMASHLERFAFREDLKIGWSREA